MYHLSNTQGTPTLHTGRKLWNAMKNFSAVGLPDWTKMSSICNLKEVVKAVWLAGKARLVFVHGEMLSGLGLNSERYDLVLSSMLTWEAALDLGSSICSCSLQSLYFGSILCSRKAH